jgi:hypothetical protein
MEAARKRGSIIGRPRKLQPEQVSWAKSMMQIDSGAVDLARVSNALDVSPRTLKRAMV